MASKAMAETSPEYFLMMTFEISSDQEALFNEIYDAEHAPYILQVEGVHSCLRFVDASPSADGWLVYSTLYRFGRPDLPDSDAWKAASDRGRWKDLIRPYVKSRQRRLGKIVIEYRT